MGFSNIKNIIAIVSACSVCAQVHKMTLTNDCNSFKRIVMYMWLTILNDTSFCKTLLHSCKSETSYCKQRSATRRTAWKKWWKMYADYDLVELWDSLHENKNIHKTQSFNWYLFIHIFFSVYMFYNGPTTLKKSNATVFIKL